MILECERANKLWPAALIAVPKDQWPPDRHGHTRPAELFRSREFVVQVFEEAEGMRRLSINRTHIDPATMDWVDGITWDDLQRLKREAGYGDRLAIEVYPRDQDVVCDARMRHLWVYPALSPGVPFAWTHLNRRRP